MSALSQRTRNSRSVCLLVAAVLLLTAGGALTAQEYIIGPGDVLRITVWGQDDLSKEYPVTLDGRVPFPLIGNVQAAGLTTTQLAKRLHDLLEKDYLVNPQVLVATAQRVSVLRHGGEFGAELLINAQGLAIGRSRLLMLSQVQE